MNLLTIALYAAGAGHFGILAASAMVPRVLDWRGTLACIHPFMRRLFWVYGGFIVLTIVGLGTLTLLHAPAMAAGDPVARSLAAFTGLFWLARLAVQFAVFDATPFLTTRALRFGYHVLTAAFVALVAVYGTAAFFSAAFVIAARRVSGMARASLFVPKELRFGFRRVNT